MTRAINKATSSIIITANTTNQTLVPAVGGVFTDIYGLIITNNSLTDTDVWISDGTLNYSVFSPGATSGGVSLDVAAAIPASQPNTIWTANTSVSVSNVNISALYVKNTI
jgi:hypothetical protein